MCERDRPIQVHVRIFTGFVREQAFNPTVAHALNAAARPGGQIIVQHALSFI